MNPNELAFRPIVTRIKASSGTLTAETAVSIAGEHLRQKRIQFAVTNLSDSVALKLQTANGRNFATVRPVSTLTFVSSADFMIYNPDPAVSVDYEVAEIYPDTGNAGFVPTSPGTAASGGGAGGGAAGAGGAGGSGGGDSGSSPGYGWGGGASQPA